MDSFNVVFNQDLTYSVRTLFREIGCLYNIERDVWYLSPEQITELRNHNIEIENNIKII